jgi:multidrug efflux pump subunit AcrA (membrane-fusion protein)
MKRKIIVGSIIAIVIIVFVSVYLSKNSGSSKTFSSGKTYNVQVDTIQKGDISASFVASGIIEATDEVDVYFDTPFKVKKILVKENEKVSKGQKILDLDFDNLNSELEQLKITREVQAMAIKKIRGAQGLKNLDSLNTAIAAAKNNMENAQKSYDDIKNDLDEAKEAYSRLEISTSELDAAEKALSGAKIALDTAKLNYESAVDNFDSAKEANQQTKSSTDIEIESQEKKS